MKSLLADMTVMDDDGFGLKMFRHDRYGGKTTRKRRPAPFLTVANADQRLTLKSTSDATAESAAVQLMAQ